MLEIDVNDPLAVAVIWAIQSGDLDRLNRLLGETPGLATAMVGDRALLHFVAVSPGHFPRGAATVAALIAAGSDPNAHFAERPPETPLHWAASCGDVEVLDALIDGGADIEARGGSIAGGTPLDNAVGYGEWRAARRLVERGAMVNGLWQAAALGDMPLVKDHFSSAKKPVPEAVSDAFWHACHGGQRRAADYLLARGADINWIPEWTRETPLDIAEKSGDVDLAEWLRAEGAESARSAQ